jgi:hypothetical protein
MNSSFKFKLISIKFEIIYQYKLILLKKSFEKQLNLNLNRLFDYNLLMSVLCCLKYQILFKISLDKLKHSNMKIDIKLIIYLSIRNEKELVLKLQNTKKCIQFNTM